MRTVVSMIRERFHRLFNFRGSIEVKGSVMVVSVTVSTSLVSGRSYGHADREPTDVRSLQALPHMHLHAIVFLFRLLPDTDKKALVRK